MAKFALPYIGASKSRIVDAASLPLHGNPDFYCATPGCHARMFVRSPQKPSACFVSYDITDHTGGAQCHIPGDFRPDEYEESLFNLPDVFNNILHPSKRERSPHFGSGKKGNNARIPVKTLSTLYKMCLTYRPKGSYNGYNINEILVDEYNCIKYATGRKIIACTYYCDNPSTQNVFMNYPGCWGKHIMVHVQDKKMYEKLTSKIRDSSHKHLTVIAGDFAPITSRVENIPAVDCVITCELTSAGKQVCRGD